MLSGREASGKTSSLKTVISTLNSKEGDKELKTVRLQKVYPKVFLDLSEVFGCMSDTGTWRDGVFTTLIRKSIKVWSHVYSICQKWEVHVHVYITVMIYMYIYCMYIYMYHYNFYY